MNRILAASVLLGVAAMMIGSILPAMAEPLAEADSHKKGHNICEKLLPALKKLVAEGKISKEQAQRIFENACRR